MAKTRPPSHQRSSLVEHYRSLQQRIFCPPTGSRPIRSVLVTANDRREGASTVASNLALYLAQVDAKRTVLLELDPFHPARRPVLPVDRSSGWIEALQQDLPLDPFVRTVEGTSLSVLPAGPVQGTIPSYSDPRFKELLQILTGHFDLVVADGPSVRGVPSILPLVGVFDGVVLVIEANRTRRQAAAKNVERLKAASGNFLGVVMNKRRYLIPGWIYSRL